MLGTPSSGMTHGSVTSIAVNVDSTRTILHTNLHEYLRPLCMWYMRVQVSVFLTLR